LIKIAVKKAKTQAESIAAALESAIVGIKSIDGNCSLSGRTVMPRMMLMAKSAGAAQNEAVMDTSTNIEVGTMTLYARINVCKRI
jgi:uncharacterized protein YggE